MKSLCAFCGLVVLSLSLSGDTPPADQQERLKKLQPLVGAWRGVGQPQRGSTKDSWVEEADWAWSFEKDGPALVGTLPSGKLFRQLRITAGGEVRSFVLDVQPLPGDGAVRYLGQLNDQEQIVFTTTAPVSNLPQRLSFRFVASGDRLLLLMEKQAPGNGQYTRLAEVGYTRQGSGFGKNVTQRECVVTGGLGTIEVTHGGKTYYVCCTGCRDYFNDNAAKVLAEYAARKK